MGEISYDFCVYESVHVSSLSWAKPQKSKKQRIRAAKG